MKMNLNTATKSLHRVSDAVGALAQENGAEGKTYHERELRSIAAFRLRDAANRVAMLVSMSTSPELRAELLAVYDRLMDEERDLVVRAMEGTRRKITRPGSSRGNQKRSLA